MKRGIVALALALALNVYIAGSASAAGSTGQGNIEVYKGGQLVDKLSGKNPIEDGALLVCDGKCMIKSEGISLVAADKAKLAIQNEGKDFNLYLREGYVNFTITSQSRKIAFHTAQGTYTAAEVIFNAGANPVVQGYVKVNKDGQTEIGVTEGRMVFATADGMKTVDANHKIILAMADVPTDGNSTTKKLTTGQKVGIGVGTGALVGGIILLADDDDDDGVPASSAN